ncbi:uncharacterized protein YwqG [Brevibacillus aydinogluensis]|jgi:uncharacterized protein YwqG|uniref:DUF1963 domain-containing protein n=1 Tax=Brevibacillus aydinogluensis TaxID=927786 RepID=A0AA48M5J6_9BACL|nr:YwqG family protein [Brevibacillus aydinogluensis]MDT3415920.1 uncharacterized protein YwqG [Brevibacillus aydinogluensis]CAJ1001656.1 DUF1963 domain-containing protein [Brevibacillus aydinogluensis]
MKKQILSLLHEAGLSRYAERFEPLIRPSFRIFTHPVDEESLSLGTSKIGGCPDLPAGTPWPYWKSYPLSFLGQINLAELPPFPEKILPERGLLLFFFAAAAMFDDDEFYHSVEKAKVLFVAETDSADLKRTAPPNELDDYDPPVRFSPCSLDYRVEWTVPPAESSDIEQLGMSWNKNRDDFDRYWEQFRKRVWEQLLHPDDMKNRLLGCPDQIQGDMQHECQLMAYPSTDRNDKAALLRQAVRWRLLFQVDSEEEKTGMMWGDIGRLYFWIEQEALERADFSLVVCIDQYH